MSSSIKPGAFENRIRNGEHAGPHRKASISHPGLIPPSQSTAASQQATHADEASKLMNTRVAVVRRFGEELAQITVNLR